MPATFPRRPGWRCHSSRIGRGLSNPSSRRNSSRAEASRRVARLPGDVFRRILRHITTSCAWSPSGELGPAAFSPFFTEPPDQQLLVLHLPVQDHQGRHPIGWRSTAAETPSGPPGPAGSPPSGSSPSMPASCQQNASLLERRWVSPGPRRTHPALPPGLPPLSAGPPSFQWR